MRMCLRHVPNRNVLAMHKHRKNNLFNGIGVYIILYAAMTLADTIYSIYMYMMTVSAARSSFVRCILSVV